MITDIIIDPEHAAILDHVLAYLSLGAVAYIATFLMRGGLCGNTRDGWRVRKTMFMRAAILVLLIGAYAIADVPGDRISFAIGELLCLAGYIYSAAKYDNLPEDKAFVPADDRPPADSKA